MENEENKVEMAPVEEVQPVVEESAVVEEGAVEITEEKLPETETTPT